VRVADDAPVCEAFAREGWCDREAGTCTELHIWECPEWHAKGTCARGTRCGLRHVLRRKGKTSETAAPATAAQDTQGEGQFEDQSEFIGLPGDVVSETSDSEEDEEDEDGEEDEDDEDEEDEDDEGSEDDNEDDKKAESMEVDGEEDSGKLPPSSPGMRTDDDDELQVLGEL